MFKPFKTAVDIGGGHGSFLSAVLDQQADARGMLLDLAPVIADAGKAGFVAGHMDRIETVDFRLRVYGRGHAHSSVVSGVA